MVGVYKITNTVNGKVYIGQSVNIESRIHKHFTNVNCKSYANSHNPHFHSAVRKYGKESFVWEVIEECDKAMLDDREQYWIAYYDSTNREKGYNVMEGGRGRRHASHERPVVCIDTESRGKVAEFETLAEAARFIGADGITGICRCCKHRRGGKTYKGYMWCYKSDYYDGIYDNVILSSSPSPRAVMQLSTDGQLIAIYPSVVSAATSVNGNHANISKALNNQIKSAYGFKWKYWVS